MYSLLTRLLSGSRFTTDPSSGDEEFGELVDGANLGEADCRWSPNMGLAPNDLEEKRPHGMPLNVPSVP
jgi:hypothetical protein